MAYLLAVAKKTIKKKLSQPYSQLQTLLELTVPSLTLTVRSRHCWNWQYPALHLKPDPDTARIDSTQPYTYSQIQTLLELAVPSLTFTARSYTYSLTLTARSRHCWTGSTQPYSQIQTLLELAVPSLTARYRPCQNWQYPAFMLTARSRHCGNWQYPASQTALDTGNSTGFCQSNTFLVWPAAYGSSAFQPIQGECSTFTWTSPRCWILPGNTRWEHLPQGTSIPRQSFDSYAHKDWKSWVHVLSAATALRRPPHKHFVRTSSQ